MTLKEELVKLAKESKDINNKYTGVKTEILNVIDMLNLRMKKHAEEGFFNTTLVIQRPFQPNILYIYGDLNSIHDLESLLKSFFDGSLDIKVRDSENPDELFVDVSWASNTHNDISKDLSKNFKKTIKTQSF